MNSATINSASFTLTPVGGVALIPASITYVASTSVATLSTSAALLPATTYNASIANTVTSSTGFNMPCVDAWSFTTSTPASTGLAQVNLGHATAFAIAATAGLTNTITAPLTHINGDVVLDPVAGATCNAVAVDGFGGMGLCGGMAPTLTGTVISQYYDPGNTRSIIKADLLAAFLSITPPAGPPAAGSLGSPTNLPAGTTLGGPVGGLPHTALNYFTPGVYQSTTSILITGDLTLDALGNPDAVFVFQSSSTLGTADGAAPPAIPTRIILAGSAKASNVWWQVGSSATLGTYSVFQGNILADTSITMGTNATSCGRLLAGAVTATGAFTFDSNVVSVPGNAFAPACK
jgi:hypothetical protein